VTAPGTARIRVLIVDDDVPTRIGLRTILSSAGDIEVVGEACGGADGVAAARRLQPDIVLMDIRLPDIDGIAATRNITTAPDSRSKVVVLTTFDFDEYAFQSRRAGASAFILKRAPAEEIIASVRAVARDTAVPGTPDVRGAQEQPATRAGRLSFTPPITSREREVLHMVAQGFTNAEVARELHLSIDTVKSHLKHIYAKSGVRDRARLVVAAQGSGFGRAPH
jgi:DNA-binding NarL/FixJ family response regulator